jgi:hypothetical protein
MTSSWILTPAVAALDADGRVAFAEALYGARRRSRVSEAAVARRD